MEGKRREGDTGHGGSRPGREEKTGERKRREDGEGERKEGKRLLGKKRGKRIQSEEVSHYKVDTE